MHQAQIRCVCGLVKVDVSEVTVTVTKSETNYFSYRCPNSKHGKLVLQLCEVGRADMLVSNGARYNVLYLDQERQAEGMPDQSVLAEPLSADDEIDFGLALNTLSSEEIVNIARG